MNKKTILAVGLMTMCAALFARPAQAAILASDDFSYTGAVTNHGWVAYNGADGSITSDGTKASIGSGAEDIRRTFGVQSNVATYASFVMRVNSLPASGNAYTVGFSDGSIMDSRFGILSVGGTGYRLAAYGVGTTILATNSAILSTNTDYLITIYFDGFSDHRLWIDAASSDFSSPAIQTTGTQNRIDGVFIRQASPFGGGTAAWTMDDLIVGTTFSDVVTSGPTLSVTLDKSNGFVVESGTSEVITASATNGVPPYSYAWTSTLDSAYFTAIDDEFTILTTAPVGNYTVTAKVIDDELDEAERTVSFSVKNKHAITITTPTNGTVTTTPAGFAFTGDSVVINATADSGYIPATYTVVGDDENPVTVTGISFTMPDQPVTVTVGFGAYEGGALIISQYYEGTSNNKWIEIFNPGASAVDLGADGYRLGIWINANREGWKTSGAPDQNMALTGVVGAGATILLRHGSATNPAYASATFTNSSVINFNGDDSLVLYTGTTFNFGNVVDAFGMIATNSADTSFVRKTNITAGVNTDFDAAEWDQFTLALVDGAAEGTNERLGYHSLGGPPTPTVQFASASASASEDIGTYEVTLVKSPASGDVSGEITLGGTAVAGTHYTIDTTNFTMNGATTSAVFTITVIETLDDDSDLTVILGIANLTGADEGAIDTFTLTIEYEGEAGPVVPSEVEAGSITISGSNPVVTVPGTAGLHYYLVSVKTNIPQSAVTFVPVDLDQWDMRASQSPVTDVTVTLTDETVADPTRIYGVLVTDYEVMFP